MVFRLISKDWVRIKQRKVVRDNGGWGWEDVKIGEDFSQRELN